MHLIHRMVIYAGVITFAQVVSAKADFVTASIGTGTTPQAVAVNPVTNKIYVANNGSGSVTVIDGATNQAAMVTVGTNPRAIAVNPVTNKIYVANNGSGSVTVIDGATNQTATVTVGTNPIVIAVNPVTNKIYVGNEGSSTVTVIDGATNATTSLSVRMVVAIAVNPVTNKIYVANWGMGNGLVNVIDGATNVVSSVYVGSDPCTIAVNPVTNKIYVGNYNTNITVIDGATNGSTTLSPSIDPCATSIVVNPVTNRVYVTVQSGNRVRVIDGATNGTIADVSAGSAPWSLAVNPVTNKVYVANKLSSSVTVIDGTTNTASSVTTGAGPFAVAVNPVTNKVYVADTAANNVTVIDGSTNSTATVSTGSGPYAIAMNPVTNKVYVANNNSGTVTVIDGATNSTAAVSAGTNPWPIAVNPVTNKIYVVNTGGTVTVIDGETNSTTTVSAGSRPYAVAVNPVTNKVYVANRSSGDVTVINGATNSTTTIGAGSYPIAVAVNPVTNEIYVANSSGNNVTVIDGATNLTATVSTGRYPAAIAVNPVTNKIYTANYDGGNVTVIDGLTKSTTTLSAGSNPWAVSANPVTNKIYIANRGSNNVMVIDGGTNATATVGTGTGPYAIAVNPVTNKIYVANYNSSNVTVIDGATNSTATRSVGTGPLAVAVNPVTGTIYVANFGGANVTVLTEAPVNDTKVWALADSLPWHSCFVAKPVLGGKAVNRAFTGKCGMQGVYNKLNTAQNAWNMASITSLAGTDSTRWSYGWGTSDSLSLGENFLCMFAADSQCATLNNLGTGTPFTGNMAVYPIYYIPVTLSAPANGVFTQPTSLTLSWNPIAGAVSYEVQVSTASNFSTTVLDQSGATTLFTSVSGLANCTAYFWRANVATAGGTSPWSSVWSFTTILAAPVLASPANGAMGQSTSPTMSWGAVAGATSYSMLVSTVSTFASTVSNQTGLTAASCSVSGLAEKVNYYWRVNASNSSGTGDWSAIWNFVTLKTCTIPLPAGWNTKSLNVRPLDSAAASIFGPGRNFLFVKNNAGQVYCPTIPLDEIQFARTGQAYQIYTDLPDTLRIPGMPFAIVNTPLALPSGWNMIAYLPQVNDSVRHALAGITASLLLVKNNAGRIYCPEMEIDDIRTMAAGEGYKCYIRQDAILLYPDPLSGVSKRTAVDRPFLRLPEPRHFANHAITGSNATLLVKEVGIGGTPVPDSSEVGAFDGQGNLVGSGSVLHGKTAFALWGDDPMTKKVKDGLASGEKVTFKLWTAAQEFPLDFVAGTGSEARYTEEGLISGSLIVSPGALIKRFDLLRAYPNPFRGSVRIAFDVPTINSIAEYAISIEIYDLKGSIVEQVAKGKYRAGHYAVTWSGGQMKNGTAGSSVYIVRMRAEKFDKRLKVIRL